MAEKEPQFVVNDRRKFNIEGELRDDAPVVTEERQQVAATKPSVPESAPSSAAASAAVQDEKDLPTGPTKEESVQQHAAYRTSTERLEEMVRAQNPGGPREPEVSFLHVVQSLYMTALMQLGVGTPQGAQMRV